MPVLDVTFDAELAPRLLQPLFEEVEMERWDAPLLELPDRGAVRDYLVGKGSRRTERRLARSRSTRRWR